MGVYVSRKAQILDLLFGATSFTVESTFYLGLSTTTFTTATEVTTFPTEPSSGAAYARVTLSNNKTLWSNATTNSAGASLYNNSIVQFAESTASWGQINGIFIAATLAGTTLADLLYYENLASPITVGVNTTVFFNANALTISMPAVYS
jgi:hypothetical protein